MANFVADFLTGVPVEIDFVRDTSAREFDENGVLRTFAINQPAGPAYGPDGEPLGLAVWASYTNSFRNSDAPATQTVALKAGYYTLSVRGTGSISIPGVGTALEGAPLVYTIAEDQNVTFQVTGDVLYGANDSQLYPGSPIGTGDSAVRRGADFPTINLLDHPLVDLSAFTVMLEFMPLAEGLRSGNMLQFDDGTKDNRITVNYHYTDAHSGVTVVEDGMVTGISDPQPPYTMLVGEVNRVALTVDRANNRIGISLNGSPVFWRVLSGWPENLSTLRIGTVINGTAINGYVRRLEISDDVATDTQLQALTDVGYEPNVVLGGQGADTLIGTSGDDVIFGDRLHSDAATADVMHGGAGDDKYYSETDHDVIIENPGEGYDVVFADAHFTIAPGSEIEELRANRITGSILTGNEFANRIIGSNGNDTLEGGGGSDILMGGSADDTYIVRGSGDQVIELSDGNDTVLSFISYVLPPGLENLYLQGDATSGKGNSLANTIAGNNGDNTLNGGAGADAMAGAAGNDTYIVDNALDVVVENLDEGTDTVQSSVTYALSANAENLTLTGTGNISGTGNGLANTITGNPRNNTLDGGAGVDALIGGAGNDTYIVDNVADVVTENTNAGTDTVQSSVTYMLSANVERLTLTDTGNSNGTGNALANIITGNSGDNVLDGGTAGDTMIGSVGNDTYLVNSASDVVNENANEGTDLVQAALNCTLSVNVENLALTGTANFRGTGNDLGNTITGNTGSNVLDGGAGVDTMVGGLGNDTSVVDNVLDIVIEVAGQGTDTVQSSVTYVLTADVEKLTLTGTASIDGKGNALANTITGSSGANVLEGDAGNDTMIGGEGNDTYVVDGSADVVSENLNEGVDLVSSSITYTLGNNLENLTLRGSANLNGTGNAAINIITGNGGDNKLAGGAGADAMAGGDGNDVYIVDDSGDVVTESSDTGGSDLVMASASFVLGANIESLTLTGAANINGTGNAANNIITGNGGDNALDGQGGTDSLKGSSGNDTYVIDNAGVVVTEGSGAGTDTVRSSITFIVGSNLENLVLTGAANVNGTGNTFANTITGNGGENTLDGGTGADSLAGDAGNDTYIVDNLGDAVIETSPAAGVELVNSSVTFTLGANVENLTLTGKKNINGTGNGDANSINGNDHANVIDGGAGADVMRGRVGADIYYVDNAGDVAIEILGEGTDTIYVGVDYTLMDGNAIEFLIANAGTGGLRLAGNEFANKIAGDAGNDTLSGGGGNDTLDGSAGSDTLTGSAGADVFKFSSIIDTGVGTPDLIADFAGTSGDKIDLTAIDADPTSAGDQAFIFIGSAAFSAVGQVFAQTIGADTHVFGTTNGTSATFEILIGGTQSLVASNFNL